MERSGPPPGSGPEYYLQNYRLGRTLGIGSFGKVKVAEHTLTGHQVAIKILNRKKIQTMDMEEKVRREIKILKLFMHPHIIRLYEVIDTPTDIYVIMEYVQCGELFDYIVEKGRLLEDSARRFFQQILSGVEYCHRNMVVHRDLKPENLLLDSKHHVKIADFGLSNVMRDGHFLKTSCGSPNYAAPEVISGKLYAGPEVDVWSCGVILYALLCGSLPFDDENIPNLFKKIKNGIYTLPNHLSPGARDLIPRMLLVDPMKRITIPEIRQHPWFTTHLPRYLAVMQADTIMTAPRIDPEILEDVVKRGFDKEAVIESLTTRGQSKATVMYHLLLDQSRQIPNSGYLGGELSEASAAQLTGMFLPTTPSPTTTTKKSEAALQQRRVAQRQWRLGGQLKGGPGAIMSKLHSILRANGVVWKKMGPYSVRCRKLLDGESCGQGAGLMEAEDSELSSGEDRNLKDGQKAQDHVLKFEIQMYKVKDEEFALDFQVTAASMKYISLERLPTFIWQCCTWAVHCCYSVLAGLTLWILTMALCIPDMGSGVLAIVAGLATLIICTVAYGKSPACCLEQDKVYPCLTKGRYHCDCGRCLTACASYANMDSVFVDV